MASQHENLMRTMRWFLDEADPNARVWVVAGFHTGRAIVAGFFETAVRMGMAVERIYERDLNAEAEDGGEVRREWKPAREGEGPRIGGGGVLLLFCGYPSRELSVKIPVDRSTSSESIPYTPPVLHGPQIETADTRPCPKPPAHHHHHHQHP